jgi:hypothetical protein
VRGKSFEIAWVRSEHGPAGLGHGDHQCVDGGASAGMSSQERRATSEWLIYHPYDIARLQKLVLRSIAPRVPLEAFDQDH